VSPLNAKAAETLASFPLPLQNLSIRPLSSIEEFAEATSQSLAILYAESTIKAIAGKGEVDVVDVGKLRVVAGKTTPMNLIWEANHNIAVQLCVKGLIEYRSDFACMQANDGCLLVVPNEGRPLAFAYHSGLSFQLDRSVLQRAISVIGGVSVPMAIDHPFVNGVEDRDAAARLPRILFRFFDYIDSLLLEDPALPSCLDLDDQIYRLFALEYLAGFGVANQAKRRQRSIAGESIALDDLVDWIKANLHRPLTLTDLQERSHYSTRQLQHLFKTRLNCSPMDFVRRERLGHAMDRLDSAGPGESVSTIARACGYRHLSNFSSDFRRQFGFSPSQVLRASKR